MTNISSFETKKSIAISDKHSVWRKIPTSPFSLQRISHDKCGRALNFMCLFGSTFMFQPIYSSLQRTVGDYLDHSIIPRPTYTGPFKPLHHSSRLPLSHTESTAHFPTPQLSLGWGFCSLVPAELG